MLSWAVSLLRQWQRQSPPNAYFSGSFLPLIVSCIVLFGTSADDYLSQWGSGAITMAAPIENALLSQAASLDLCLLGAIASVVLVGLGLLAHGLQAWRPLPAAQP